MNDDEGGQMNGWTVRTLPDADQSPNAEAAAEARAAASSAAWWAALPPMPGVDGSPLEWDTFLEDLRRWNERSRLVRMPADGKTIHVFERLSATDDFLYQAVDVVSVREAYVGLQLLTHRPETEALH